MPHVVIKLLSGRSDKEKVRIAAEVTKALTAAGVGEDAVSVAIKDVDRRDWTETVYEPEIRAKASTLYKRPGYEPF